MSPKHSDDTLFTALAHRHIVPRLPAQAEEFKLYKRVVPGHATSEFVRFLHTAPDGWIVLRGFHRLASPLGFRGTFSRFNKAAQITSILHDRGFPVPRILGLQRGYDWRIARQYLFSAEEFIEGPELSKDRPELVTKLFAIMGALHSIRSDSMGRAWNSGRFVRTFQRNPARALKRTRRLLSRVNLNLSSHDVSSMLGWMVGELQKVKHAGGTKPFSLVHGDCRHSNVIVRSGNDLALIDFMHTRFEFAGMELTDALAHFAARRPQYSKQYIDAYLQALSPELHEQLHTGFPVFGLMNTIYRLERMKQDSRALERTKGLLAAWTQRGSRPTAGLFEAWSEALENLGPHFEVSDA